MTDNIQIGFDPLHDAHAIEQVVFGVQFEQPLNPDALNSANEIVDGFANKLPAEVKLQVISVAFGNPATPAPPPPAAGKIRQYVLPDKTIGAELKVDPTSIVFRTTRYTRWDGVWGEAKAYFDALLPIFAANGKLINISLNYVDKFIWNGPLDKFQPRDLLCDGSKLFSSHILESSDLWHSHTGAFTKVDNHRKRLFNVNLDCNDEQKGQNSRRVVSVLTVISDIFNQPGYESLNQTAYEPISYVSDRMQELHGSSKLLFSNIINEKMCKRIALVA